MKNQEFIIGEVKATFFESFDNFYKVLLVEVLDTDAEYSEEEIVVTGHFGAISNGEQYKFIGKLVHHPKYGLQFQSDQYIKNQPSNEEALIKFLSSKEFPGIGEVTAGRLVDELGTDLVQRISEEEKILDSLSFLSKKQRTSLLEGIQKSNSDQQAIIFLNKLGLGNERAYRIYDQLKEETIDKVKTNPYILYEILENFSFERADQIAMQLEIAPDDLSRIEAGILYTLTNNVFGTGDTFMELTPLIEGTIHMLEHARPFIIDPDLLYKATENLVQTERLIIEDSHAYLPTLFKAEYGIAHSINRLLADEIDEFSEDEIEKVIDNVEQQTGIQYDEIQKEAILKAVNSPLFILTGGPGTGKTTVIEGIIQTYAKLHDIDLSDNSLDDNNKLLQAAPTGRAAKRMEEATGIPSRTIHSLLQLKVDEIEESFEEAEITLEGKLLIVDEMSMIDTWLMNQLLTSVPNGMQVILIGDPYQLPPVGPGQVFRDLIEIDLLPIIQLNKIYRQAQDSSIVELAYEIKKGNLPQNFLEQTHDRNFFPARMEDVPAIIEIIVEKAIQKGFTSEEIQVLSPMYRTPAGVNHLNVKLQALFNPPNPEKEEFEFNKQIFRVGDKILQTKNDPEQGVFNGDMGVITGFVDKRYTLSKRDEMILEFNGKEVYYTRSDWIHLSLAYACSIHKAQGSEYPIVVLPLVPAFNRMLKRDLLYTAVTRASQSLILCGDAQSFAQALKYTSAMRKTTLKERLLGKEETVSSDGTENTVEESIHHPLILTPEKVLEGSIGPLIGMENITPYDN